VKQAAFWYAGGVKSSVSIALFFLLSGFFLSLLLGAIEHSGKLLAVSGACLAAVVCIIVFLTPVELPSLHSHKGSPSREAVTTVPEDASPGGISATTEPKATLDAASPVSLTTELSSAASR
jgi:hypothetical protein